MRSSSTFELPRKIEICNRCLLVHSQHPLKSMAQNSNIPSSDLVRHQKSYKLYSPQVHFSKPSRMQNIWDGIWMHVYIRWTRPITKFSVYLRMKCKIYTNLYFTMMTSLCVGPSIWQPKKWHPPHCNMLERFWENHQRIIAFESVFGGIRMTKNPMLRK